MKALFKIKDENLYPACKIYYGEYEQYRGKHKGETVPNTATRGSGYSNPDHKSEPLECIKRNIGHGRFYAQLLHRNISGRIQK